MDRAWLVLAKSIPEKDHGKTETALKVIADDWIDLTEGDCMNFHPYSFPDFETPVCAAAALARRSGFIASSLNHDQYQFLEPGLATPEPTPLVSRYFGLPPHWSS